MVQVWEAVKADDWYRFFKAVREATYLQSCVLHLYFNSIRQRALQIMNRAFKYYAQHLAPHIMTVYLQSLCVCVRACVT